MSVDKSGSNKSALDCYNEELLEEWQYESRQVKYLNNICKQKRTKMMLGFNSFESAEATLAVIEAIRMIWTNYWTGKMSILFQQLCKSDD